MTTPSAYRIRRLLSLLAVGALLAAACSGGGERDLAAPSPTPTATSTLASPPSWPPPTEEPTTAEEKVVAVSDRYLELASEALQCATRDDLESVRGCFQALPWEPVATSAAQRQVGLDVWTLFDQGNTPESNLWLGTITNVQAPGDGATLRTCGVSRSRSWRDFTFELRRQEGDWQVTSWAPTALVEAEERGATAGSGDLGCIPDEEQLEEQILEAYTRYDRGVKAAFASGNPDHPALAATTNESQRQHLSEEIAEDAAKGHVYRDFSQSHPEVAQIRSDENNFGWSVAIVRDCVLNGPQSGVYDRETGEPISVLGPDAGRSLSLTQLELLDHGHTLAWKVEATEIEEEDSSCVATEAL